MSEIEISEHFKNSRRELLTLLKIILKNTLSTITIYLNHQPLIFYKFGGELSVIDRKKEGTLLRNI